MIITTLLYLKTSQEWRQWLKRNYKKEKEVWLAYYKKGSGKPRIPYFEAVEEALCFGWIDSTVKKIDNDAIAQRFSPRNPKSSISELNKERVRTLIKQNKMTPDGLSAIKLSFDPNNDKFTIPTYLIKEIKKDDETWNNFQKFPESYKRIKIGWLTGSYSRQDEYIKRLNYFLKMTKKNKMYGMLR